MAARQRASVEKSDCSESQMTYSRFLEMFPSNDACLDYLKAKFYPDGSACPGCRAFTKFHRIKSRAAYSCQYCRHQVYPTAGTIFHKSTTSLQLWFWAVFLMSSTRCGISAKQLEREIGVSYPTAHRMFKQIRSLLSDSDDPLSGEVEMDETLIGGDAHHSEKVWRNIPTSTERRQASLRWVEENKTSVFAMVERGGRVRGRVTPDRRLATLDGHISQHVLPSSMIFTDEYSLYTRIGQRFAGHKRVNHSANVYVDGDAHTNTIEGFFGLLKTGIRGVYHSVSTKYLQNYIDEYAFRYNRRDGQSLFFGRSSIGSGTI
jgi:transposase-like protein